MEDLLEFMCLQCGISVHLGADVLAADDRGDGQSKVLNNVFCTECGGPLHLIGKVGEEPCYRVG